MRSNLSDAVLIVWLGTECTPEDFDALKNFIAPFFEQPTSLQVIVFPPTNGKNFSPRALRRATHFIATREMSTLEATDYLWGTQVKIISALDENIFADAH